eukprot:Transcript_13280.p2 GENE.Transcript_13280~~Transcript_13280.p2  ORF type:complete len:270 (+),score=78.45 Transcript_13280:340-1149(+)
MRLVLQRVSEASVTVDGEVVGRIGAGLMCLVGISAEDGPSAIEWATRRILGIRLWEDAGKAWTKSVTALGLEVLIVSQFTLYCALKGHKPDFHYAMPPAPAREFWAAFVQAVCAAHPGKVQQGQFGAKMQVALVNEGPVTIELESPGPSGPPQSEPAPKLASGAKAAAVAAPPVLLVLHAGAGGAYGFAGLRECERRGARLVAAKTVRSGDSGGALAILVDGASAAAVRQILARAGAGAGAVDVHEGEEAAAGFFAPEERRSTLTARAP